MTTQNDRLASTPESGSRAACVAATTANITLSGLQTVDTVVLAAGDRVLVKDQTDGTEDGVYIVSTTDWSRAKDWNASDDLQSGILIPVGAGATNLGLWQVTYSGAFVLGTTEPTITQLA